MLPQELHTQLVHTLSACHPYFCKLACMVIACLCICAKSGLHFVGHKHVSGLLIYESYACMLSLTVKLMHMDVL